jgi:hypothetical protein
VKAISEFMRLSENQFEEMKEIHKLRLTALEAAIQTLRKTACYGYNGKPPDFEWPTPKDLLEMSKSTIIKL